VRNSGKQKLKKAEEGRKGRDSVERGERGRKLFIFFLLQVLVHSFLLFPLNMMKNRIICFCFLG